VSKDQVKVNHEQGSVYVPGQGSLPLIGVDAKTLGEQEKRHERTKLQIRRMKMSIWKCTQCKRKQSGKFVRYRPEMIDGIMTDGYHCFDKRCDGRVVISQDAFDLRNGPREARAELKRTSFSPKEMRYCTAQVFERFLETEYKKGGMGAQVEIGRQVQCSVCTECVVLQKNWVWEVMR
jgi:hypothetical protein